MNQYCLKKECAAIHALVSSFHYHLVKTFNFLTFSNKEIA